MGGYDPLRAQFDARSATAVTIFLVNEPVNLYLWTKTITIFFENIGPIKDANK